MSSTYYVMHRAGVFTTAGAPNQCKAPNHIIFNYLLTMVFPGDMKLDNIDQIIDHALIDKTVRECNPAGSCERMHKMIFDAVGHELAYKGIPLLACKCVIVPDPANKLAILSHVWVDDHINQHLLPLLNEPVLAMPTMPMPPAATTPVDPGFADPTVAAIIAKPWPFPG